MTTTGLTGDVLADDHAEVVETQGASARRTALRRFLRHGLAVAGLIVLLLLIAIALLAPLLAPHDPTAQDLSNPLAPAGAGHPLGTDDLGRDLLSRLLYGGRIPLVIGFGSTAVVLLIGVAIGAAAGYVGGWVDNALMRLVDVALAFPVFFLLVIVAAYSGVTVPTIILFIGLFNWMYLARLVRSEFLVMREIDYVRAARASGVSGWRIVWRHMLPNAVAPIIVNATFSIAGAMYIEAALDFVGSGLPPDVPTWGNMLAASQPYIVVDPPLAIVPGALLLLAILAVNFVGDGLRDAFDPRGG